MTQQEAYAMLHEKVKLINHLTDEAVKFAREHKLAIGNATGSTPLDVVCGTTWEESGDGPEWVSSSVCW